MKLLTAAAGALLLATAFATPSQAAPMAPPATTLTDTGGQITQVQMRRHHNWRHRNWRRGHHYGWRHHRWHRPMHRGWRHPPHRRHWR